MAEERTTPRPRPGGSDTLTQLLDEGLRPLDGPLSGPVISGHPWETPGPDEEPADTPAPRLASPPAPADIPPGPRYENYEAAERAALEAQQRITEETQRRAALEREIELYRQHNTLLERQIQHGSTLPPDARPSETPAGDTPAPFNAKTHFQQAYQRMAALNPAAEDFEQQQQQVFIDALDAAFTRLSSGVLTAEQIQARIEAGIEAAVPAVQQHVRQQTERERLVGKLTRYGTEHGLNMDQASEHYQDVMYAVERNLYPATATEDEAIAYVIDRVAQLRGVASTTPRTPGSPPPPSGARPATTPSHTPQRVQALNTPMERSGMGRQTEAPDEMDTRPFSLSEMLDRSMRARRP